MVFFDSAEKYINFYEENRKRYLDFTNSMTSAEERGEERGLKRGREEGLELGRIETAKNLLRMKMSIENIHTATGLSREKIEEIKKS